MPSKLPAVWLLLGVLPALPAAALERLSAEQLAQRLATAEARGALAAQQRTPASGQLALLREAQRLAGRDPALGEALLYRALLRLREPGSPRDAETRALLDSLSRYPPQILVPPADPDHGRGLWVPAHDVAAAARGTLAIWALQSRQQSAQLALEQGDYPALLAGDDEALAAVFAEAPLVRLRPLATRGPWPAATLAVLARRLGDAGLATQLLQRGDEATLLAALPALVEGLPPASAQDWLEQVCAQRPALASAALLAMGRLLPEQTRAQDYLLARLADPQLGGSSARALASAGTAPVRAALSEIVAGAPDGPRLRRALLALHWMDDAAAREPLRRFAAAPERPAALRREVASWLH